MTCYHPWVKVSRIGTDSQGTLPCGRCIGCMSDRGRAWAIRCYHEQSLHLSSSFLTLTYNDAHLVYGATGPTLVPEHLTLFLNVFVTNVTFVISPVVNMVLLLIVLIIMSYSLVLISEMIVLYLN